MPRHPRIATAKLSHHVVHRGINRQCIFLQDDDRRTFLRLLGRAKRTCGIEIHAYCLMTNHYHLMLGDPAGLLSKAMQLVNGAYTRAFNLCHNKEGALLRGRFFSKPIYEPGYALTLLRYIHLNPVAAGIVRRPLEYPWSSLQAYQAPKSSNLVTTSSLMGLLNKHGVEPGQIEAWILDPSNACGRQEILAFPQTLRPMGPLNCQHS